MLHSLQFVKHARRCYIMRAQCCLVMVLRLILSIFVACLSSSSSYAGGWTSHAVVHVACQAVMSALNGTEPAVQRDAGAWRARSSPRRVGDWNVLKTIGSGGYAKVKQAEHRHSRKPAAIKIYNLVELATQDIRKTNRGKRDAIEHVQQRILDEINVLRELQHPNIIAYYNYHFGNTHLYVVTELAAGGELYYYVKARTRLKEETARAFFQQLVNALNYCHQKGIVHRDVKLENLLLTENYKQLKLADFGFSRSFKQNEPLFTVCGSSQYAAPEMVNEIGYDAPPADVWSAGVVLYAMLYGTLPFGQHGENAWAIIRSANGRDYCLDDAIVAFSANNLLTRLLEPDPSQRIGLRAVLQHSWMKAESNNSSSSELSSSSGSRVTGIRRMVRAAKRRSLLAFSRLSLTPSTSSKDSQQ